MRYLVGFVCVLAGLVALPLSAGAQGDQRTEQEPALDLEWLEWSDLQWLQWLLDVEQLGEPERWTRSRPPSEGSWLRLEAGFAGMRVVPRPLPSPPPEVPRLNKRQRIGVGVGVGLALALGITTAATVSTLGGYGRQ